MIRPRGCVESGHVLGTASRRSPGIAGHRRTASDRLRHEFVLVTGRISEYDRGAPGGIRTHTRTLLRGLPLPVGPRGRQGQPTDRCEVMRVGTGPRSHARGAPEPPTPWRTRAGAAPAPRRTTGSGACRHRGRRSRCQRLLGLLQCGPHCDRPVLTHLGLVLGDGVEQIPFAAVRPRATGGRAGARPAVRCCRRGPPIGGITWMASPRTVTGPRARAAAAGGAEGHGATALGSDAAARGADPGANRRRGRPPPPAARRRRARSHRAGALRPGSPARTAGRAGRRSPRRLEHGREQEVRGVGVHRVHARGTTGRQLGPRPRRSSQILCAMPAAPASTVRARAAAAGGPATRAVRADQHVGDGSAAVGEPASTRPSGRCSYPTNSAPSGTTSSRPFVSTRRRVARSAA